MSSKKKVTRGRPKTVDREHLVSVAMQAYWAEDVQTVSLNEICRRAGVSKPGLYREFGNEDGLMQAVVAAYRSQMLAPLYERIAADAPFEETLATVIELMTTATDTRSAPKGCIVVKLRELYSRVGQATREQIDQAKTEALAVYAAWIERAKANGELSMDLSSEFAARYIDAQLNNAVSLVARNEPSDEVKQMLTLALTTLR